MIGAGCWALGFFQAKLQGFTECDAEFARGADSIIYYHAG